jgi:hypothetical protein
VTSFFARRAVPLAAAFIVVWADSACRRNEPAAPPVATASVTLGGDKAPLGSPIEMAYKFVVANDARFTEDYRVMLHVLDADEQLIFTFDHDPAVPTTQWKPGQTIEYRRTEFVPIYPYVGDASVEIGLYSPTTQKRLPLAGGPDSGQRAYKVARFQLQPQTDNVFLVFKDGWHPAETPDHNSSDEWHWTKKTATIAFKNPKRDSTLYLELDNPGGVFNEPQEVRVSVAEQTLDTFTLSPGAKLLRKVKMTAAQLGAADMIELRIDVDKTFVPALIAAGGSKDPRELGVRVFHAFVQPNN